jgi:hypothetical protein
VYEKFPKTINLLVSLMELQWVFCEAGTEYLNFTYMYFMFRALNTLCLILWSVNVAVSSTEAIQRLMGREGGYVAGRTVEKAVLFYFKV